ncbi:MAG: hypothetical protein R3248_05945 [Candidatus Promineifilaceae bacterium]|nr:hypothetical protein [Candidatus Promineifilaceae bacterium]
MDELKPTLEEFQESALETVRAVAPPTLIFAAGGTRRGAALAGVSPQSDDYARWSRERMMSCFDLIFRHGVQHIFTFAIVNSQFEEVTEGYREKLISWVDWGLAGPEALREYDDLGWRVRLLGTDGIQPLQETARRLEGATPDHYRHTLWWYVVPDLDAPWRWLLDAAYHAQAQTREEVVRALYGEDIPPASLFLSFGKPMVSPALLPPPLVGSLHCYWLQRPSYELSQRQFRHILYDYAYLRATWQEDKGGRAEQALNHRDLWEDGPTIGLGQRLGPFWYPAPIDPPEVG